MDSITAEALQEFSGFGDLETTLEEYKEKLEILSTIDSVKETASETILGAIPKYKITHYQELIVAA